MRPSFDPNWSNATKGGPCLQHGRSGDARAGGRAFNFDYYWSNGHEAELRTTTAVCASQAPSHTRLSAIRASDLTGWGERDLESKRTWTGTLQRLHG